MHNVKFLVVDYRASYLGRNPVKKFVFPLGAAFALVISLPLHAEVKTSFGACISEAAEAASSHLHDALKERQPAGAIVLRKIQHDIDTETYVYETDNERLMKVTTTHDPGTDHCEILDTYLNPVQNQ